MVKKTKAKKFRGSGSHGRGQKGGRGKGLRGGSGRAGLHKHKYATTVKLEAQGIRVFGRYGFVRHAASKPPAGPVLNVGDLALRFPGQRNVDLEAQGFSKLLGAGTVGSEVTVKVPAASAQAVSKIKAAGGSVTVTAPPPKPAPAKPAAAPPTPKPGPSGPPAGKPTGKPPSKETPK